VFEDSVGVSVAIGIAVGVGLMVRVGEGVCDGLGVDGIKLGVRRGVSIELSEVGVDEGVEFEEGCQISYELFTLYSVGAKIESESLLTSNFVVWIAEIL
jgi:hypothetical protein